MNIIVINHQLQPEPRHAKMYANKIQDCPNFKIKHLEDYPTSCTRVILIDDIEKNIIFMMISRPGRLNTLEYMCSGIQFVSRDNCVFNTLNVASI